MPRLSKASAKAVASLAQPSWEQQKADRERDAHFHRVQEERIAQQPDRGHVEQAADQPADPKMIAER